MFVSDSKRLAFIHSPKCGGTAIRESLKKDLHDLRRIGPGHSFPADIKGRRRSYYKVVFVRNPWTRLVSLYNYLRAQEHLSDYFRFGEEIRWLGFNAFVRSKELRANFPLQTKWTAGVDEVFNFEHLQSDYNRMRERISLRMTTLHIANSSYTEDYWSPYTRGLVRYVSEWQRADIEAFGYEFGIEKPRGRRYE